MDGFQQFEHTKIAFLAQLSSLSQHLKSAADVAEQYHALVAQMPYTPSGGNFIPHDGVLAVAPVGGGRKRKNGSDEGEGKRKKKKERDPEMPKRAASAYLFFQNEVRQELKVRHPFTPHHELLGMIAGQWQNMSAEERKPYEDRQRDAKRKYEVEIAAYNRKHGIEPKVPAGKKIKSVSPTTPVVPAVVPVKVEIPVVASPESSEESEVASEEESEADEAQMEAGLDGDQDGEAGAEGDGPQDEGDFEEEEEEEEEEEAPPPAKKPKSRSAAPPTPPAKVKKERKSKA